MPIIINGFPQYDSPFGNESIFSTDEEGYVIYIDFKKLLSDITKYRKVGMSYNYMNYESKLSIPYRSLITMPDDIQNLTEDIVEEIEDHLKIKLPPFPEPGKKVNNPYRDKETNKILSFEGKLNIRQGFLPLDQKHIGFKFELDIEKQIIRFSDYFFYKEDASKKYKSNVAIIISTNRYTTYLKLSEIEGLYLSPHSKEAIITKFKNALITARKNADKLAWVYDCIPDFVLGTFTDKELWEDLQFFELGAIDYIAINKYACILRLLAAAKDYEWWVTKINETPSVMRILFEKFTKEYLPQLIYIAIKYGLATWTEEAYANAYTYIFDIAELDLDEDGSSDIHASGYSEFIKEKNKFKVGLITQLYEKYSLAASETIDKLYGTVSAFTPLKTVIEDQTVFIPAFVAEYFTNEKIEEARKQVINFALLMMQPGDLIIVNGAKAVSKELLSTANSGNKIFSKIGSGGFFKYFEILSRNMLKQEHEMSCASACIRQYSKDRGISISESRIIELANTSKEFGTSHEGIKTALKAIFKNETPHVGCAYLPQLTTREIAELLSKNDSWIAVIKPTGGMRHTIIVDKIVGNKVYIRDPWPLEKFSVGENGVEAIIEIDNFINFWEKGDRFFARLQK